MYYDCKTDLYSFVHNNNHNQQECSKNEQSLKPRSCLSVARRNARERRRIKNVNLAFDDLRRHVPHGSHRGKLSKVETLRSAIEYMKALQSIVDQRKTQEQLQSNDEINFSSENLETNYNRQATSESCPREFYYENSMQNYAYDSVLQNFQSYEEVSKSRMLTPETHFNENVNISISENSHDEIVSVAYMI